MCICIYIYIDIYPSVCYTSTSTFFKRPGLKLPQLPGSTTDLPRCLLKNPSTFLEFLLVKITVVIINGTYWEHIFHQQIFVYSIFVGHYQWEYKLGCPPSQDASHHQDYYIFRIGDPYKPSFATVTGRGDNPKYKPNQLNGNKPLQVVIK